MGKSEIDRFKSNQLRLQINCENMNGNGPVSCLPDLKECHEDEETKLVLPNDVDFFDNQVAGHVNDGKHIGILQSKGNILKPILNKICGEREKKFYEQLNAGRYPKLKEIEQFVPKYYGTQSINIGEKAVDCLMLEDLTKGFKEPCIMDIKIGRRTWDPSATYEKILREEEKYHDTKRDLGFCIPGFQVYKLSSGKLQKYEKSYGKKLNKDTVVDALKSFLNAETVWSRNLLVQLLVNLWQIQIWARKQRAVHLYSSSILVVYDARRLRETLEINGTIKPSKPFPGLKRKNSLYRPLSLAVLHDNESISTGFSGQIGADGPIFPNITTRIINWVPKITSRKSDKKSVPTLKRMHSFQNNYDKDLQNIRNNYVYMLDDLVSEEKNEIWATAKMIDFAHVYPSENGNSDNNYMEGIDNLVKLFEEFLNECGNRN